MQSITPWSIYQGQYETKRKSKQKESFPIKDMKIKFSESQKKKALIFNDPIEKPQTFYAYSATKNVDEPLELLCTLKIIKACLQISQQPCLYLPKVRLSPAIKKSTPKPGQYNKIKQTNIKRQERKENRIRMKNDVKKSEIFQCLPFNDEKMIRYSKGRSEQLIAKFLRLEYDKKLIRNSFNSMQVIVDHRYLRRTLQSDNNPNCQPPVCNFNCCNKEGFCPTSENDCYFSITKEPIWIYIIIGIIIVLIIIGALLTFAILRHRRQKKLKKVEQVSKIQEQNPRLVELEMKLKEEPKIQPKKKNIYVYDREAPSKQPSNSYQRSRSNRSNFSRASSQNSKKQDDLQNPFEKKSGIRNQLIL